MSDPNLPLTVVKVGGSLFYLPQLGPGLRQWLAEQEPGRTLFLPGGGPLANVIRQYHHTHQLDEEHSHWLAIRTMHVNAGLLQALLGDVPVIRHPGVMTTPTAILDASEFCLADEGSDDALPHSWRVTSDAIAARVAWVGNARRLVMLKSVTLQPPFDWRTAAEKGAVDHAFGALVTAERFEVAWVNFREWVQVDISNTPGEIRRVF